MKYEIKESNSTLWCVPLCPSLFINRYYLRFRKAIVHSDVFRYVLHSSSIGDTWEPGKRWCTLIYSIASWLKSRALHWFLLCRHSIASSWDIVILAFVLQTGQVLKKKIVCSFTSKNTQIKIHVFKILQIYRWVYRTAFLLACSQTRITYKWISDTSLLAIVFYIQLRNIAFWTEP